MRTVIARIFDYSLDGVIAAEGTSFFDFCRDLPDDPAQLDATRGFYEAADVHIMGRRAYEGGAQYFPQADDHPYAAAMNAARKVVFSRTLRTADWAGTTVAGGDLTEEIGKLTADGDGYIVAHGGRRRLHRRPRRTATATSSPTAASASGARSSAATSSTSTACRSSPTWPGRARGSSRS
jgi:dihydrofolate reductase